MENQDPTTTEDYRRMWEKPQQPNRSGRVLAGLLLIGVGGVLLASRMNALFLPPWLLSWQMFLIVLGVFIGFRHNFRNPSWLILIFIGSFFLLGEFFGISLRPYFWPLLIIGMGLFVIFKPRRNHMGGGCYRKRNRMAPTQPQPQQEGPLGPEPANYYMGSTSAEDVVESTAIFGGIKKNIISKNFKGGEVVSVFGGTELNMSQADMAQPVVLETTQIFGGTTLVVPAHWQVVSEMVAILGGVEDKRTIMPQTYDPNKVLIIKGLALFGGLNIKNY